MGQQERHLGRLVSSHEPGIAKLGGLTGCSTRCRRSLNGLSIPSLDNIQDAVLLLTTVGKSSHSAARNDGLSSGGVNDSREDSTTMTSVIVNQVSAWA
jgi:hypothetical protein